MTLEKIVIENGTLINPFEKLDNKGGEITRIVIENGEIVFAGLEELNKENDKKYNNYTRISAKGKIITPGLIDSHVHITFDFEKLNDKDFYNQLQRDIIIKTQEFLKHGVTSYMLGTMAMPMTKLEQTLDIVKTLSKNNISELFGILIEGDCINPNAAGAMNPEYIFPKSRFYLEGLVNNFKDILKKIVFAPETNPEVYYYFIEKMKIREREDIISSIGHSLATYNETRTAIEKGARVLNHFFNRDSPLHHRDIGIVGAVFSNLINNVYLELIADGIHVSPDAIKLLINAVERINQRNWEDVIIPITDGMNITSPIEKDPTRKYYTQRIGNLTIYHIDGAPYMDTDKKVLYGSLLTGDKAIKNMMRWTTKWNNEPLEKRIYGGPLEVIKSVTQTPAKAHYLDKKGSLIKGNNADIVIFDKAKEEKCEYFGDIKCVISNGIIKYIDKDFDSNCIQRTSFQKRIERR